MTAASQQQSKCPLPLRSIVHTPEKTYQKELALCALMCKLISRSAPHVSDNAWCSDQPHQCEKQPCEKLMFSTILCLWHSQESICDYQLLYRVQGPHAQERSVQIETDAERVNRKSGGWKISLWRKTKSVFNPEKKLKGSFRATNENPLVSNKHADFLFPKVPWKHQLWYSVFPKSPIPHVEVL